MPERVASRTVPGACLRRRNRVGRYHSIVKRRLVSFAVAACFGAAALLALPPTTVRADGLPDLGEASQSDFSPLLERRVGDTLYRNMRARDDAWLNDPEVAEYLNRLAARLAPHVPGEQLDFTLFGVRDAMLNAFAWPGGYIGVNSGLIVAAQSESELAGVISHEMAHVSQRHIARMVSNQGRTGMLQLASLLVAVLAARSNPEVSQAAITASTAAGIQSQLNYTRDFEREADRVGFQILEGAGFDVHGMPDFFERLQRATRLYENNAPAYLRTHPLTSERIADMQNRVQRDGDRKVQDSLEFRLVKAKLQGSTGKPREVLPELERQARAAATTADAAAWLGVAVAQLRAGNAAAAADAVAQLKRHKVDSPMVDRLAAEVLKAQGKPAEAVAAYRTSLARHPGSRALTYGLVGTLLDNRQAREALAVIEDDLRTRSGDDTLYELQGRAFAALGRRAAQHLATGEAYFLRGQMHAAEEQLQLAQRAGDADFYESSRIDARLREVRRQIQEEAREKKEPL